MMPRPLPTFSTFLSSFRRSLLLLLLVACVARAQENFPATHHAELSPINEVTPVLSEGRGLAFFKVDATAGSMMYYVSVIDLSGPVTQAGIYLGLDGQEGTLLKAITFENGGTTASGVIQGLGATDLIALQTGGAYVNIFTAQETAGEIRGQIIPFANLGSVLRSTNEVPPASESDGTGEVEAILDIPSRTLYYRIDWTELTGQATMAHFHQAFAGSSGSSIEPISLTGADSSSDGIAGTWTGLTDAEIASILAGEIYVNLHTAKYTEGEIRGQLYPINYYTSEVRLGSVAVARPVGAGLVRAFLDLPLAQLDGVFYVGGLNDPITKAVFQVHPDASLISELNSGITQKEWLLFDFFDRDTIRSWAERGMYVDFQTESLPIAARAVLTPAVSNLTAAPTSAVPVALPGADRGGLSAWYDRSGETITFALPSGAGNGTLAIYSSLGRRVATIDLSSESARLAVGALPAGVYFAQLVTGGVPVATCRVPVLR